MKIELVIGSMFLIVYAVLLGSLFADEYVGDGERRSAVKWVAHDSTWSSELCVQIESDDRSVSIVCGNVLTREPDGYSLYGRDGLVMRWPRSWAWYRIGGVKRTGKRVLCPVCVDSGYQSTVSILSSATSLMHCGSDYYDSTGALRSPQPCNYTRQSCACSRGHHFDIRCWGDSVEYLSDPQW